MNTYPGQESPPARFQAYPQYSLNKKRNGPLECIVYDTLKREIVKRFRVPGMTERAEKHAAELNKPPHVYQQ